MTDRWKSTLKFPTRYFRFHHDESIGSVMRHELFLTNHAGSAIYNLSNDLTSTLDPMFVAGLIVSYAILAE